MERDDNRNVFRLLVSIQANRALSAGHTRHPPMEVSVCVSPRNTKGFTLHRQGGGGDVEELRPTKLSSTPPGNVPAWAAGGYHSSSFTFHLISCSVIPLCLTQQEQKPTRTYPIWIISSSCVCHSRCLAYVAPKIPFHLRFHDDHHHHQHHLLSLGFPSLGCNILRFFVSKFFFVVVSCVAQAS